MERGHLKTLRMSPEPSSIAGEQSSASHRLPPEIVLFEILPWLPLQTILRFRRVCRDWNHIISGGNRRLAIKQFQNQAHRQPSPTTSIGVIYGFACSIQNLIYRSFLGYTLPLPPIPTSIYVKRMEASTNGLSCLVCVDDILDKSRPFAYIYNPFMGKPGERVPLVHGEDLETFSPYLGPIGKTTRSLGLAFDPLASIRDDDYAYKLVQFDCICSESSRYELRFFVYSSNSGRWVRSGSKASMAVDPSVSLPPLYWYSCPIFYAGRGKLYWHIPCFLVRYDAERDVADCMAMPELPAGARDVQRQELMMLRGGRLLCTRLLRRNGCLEIWALLGDKQWERRKNVFLYGIMETGMRMEGLIELKDDVDAEWKMRPVRIYEGQELMDDTHADAEWFPRGVRIYEDEEYRGRMYLRVFFNCSVCLWRGGLDGFMGALDYDLNEDRVVRRRKNDSLIRKFGIPDPSMFMSGSPIFTIYHTLFAVPT